MISVLDSTLREGEQFPGVYFSPEQKLVIARKLDAIGVDIIEAGNPRVDPEIEHAIRRIAKAGLKARIGVHSRCNLDDVRLALECDAGFLGVFLAVADARVTYDYRRSNAGLLHDLHEVVAFAREYRPAIQIRFTIEDVLRTEPTRVVEASLVALRAGADVIGLADTTGHGQPGCKERSLGHLVRSLKESFRNHGFNPLIEAHCHNDRGLALANALEAFQAGADVIDTSVMGLGERTGIVDLASLLINLAELTARPDRWQLQLLPELYEFVSQCTGIPVAVASPALGRHAFTHTAGVHIKAMTRDSTLYQSLNPDLVGRKWSYHLGLQAGTAAVQLALQQLGRDELSQNRVAVSHLLRQVKDLARSGAEISLDGRFLEFVKHYEGTQTGPGCLPNPGLRTPTGSAGCQPSHPFTVFPLEAIDQSIARRFEQQAERHPDREAVRTPQASCTYAELNARANVVAHALRRERPDVPEPVAILAEHGITMIVAVLGVLKAGKFYVPLDANLPTARLQWILGDTDCQMIVTDEGRQPVAEALARGRLRVLNVNDLSADPSCANPGAAVDPDQPALVIFTSGSTGTPKGVIQTHRTLLHNVRNYTNGIHIAPDDRMLLLAALSFTASVSGLFGALLNGAASLPFDFKRLGLDRLASWLSEGKVSIYHSVPTIFRHLCEHLDPGKPPGHLRLIKLGGEAVTRREVELYRRHFSDDCLLHVGLGSTEMNIIRQYFLDKWTDFDGTTVPVGYPVENVETLLLDDQGNLCGEQRTGEIVIRSRYLSPGYWNRPDQTAAAYQPDALDPKMRLYRTGDLGFLDLNGCLVHRGRKDLQVKIRGQRVELEEIERTLMQVASVRDAVVVAWPRGGQELQLVAYVVPRRPVAADPAEWRSYLELHLPHYMIPARFVTLAEMPLNANGKADRKNLPPPDPAPPESAQGFAGPRSPTEELVCSIWRDVLGTPRVGVFDNFIALGGDSLGAMRVVTCLRRVLGLDVPLRSLFEAPTVATLAELIDGLRTTSPSSQTGPDQICGKV